VGSGTSAARPTLLDEARVNEVVDLRNRFDDADLEQQVAASLVKAWNSPAKNFWFAALSCQRRYFAELPNCSPDCFTSAPMIS
jgi:hypothetical protein